MEEEFAKALDALHSSVDAALHTKSTSPAVKIETNPWTKPAEVVVNVPEKVVEKSSKSSLDFWMPVLILSLLAFGSYYVQTYVYKPSLTKETNRQTLNAGFDRSQELSKELPKELPNIDLQYLAAIKTQQEALAKPVTQTVPHAVSPEPIFNPFSPKVVQANPPKTIPVKPPVSKGFSIVGEIPQIDFISEEKPSQDSKKDDKIVSQTESDQIAEQMAKRREQQMLEQERLRQEAEANHMIDD